jgi:hypothetical protein
LKPGRPAVLAATACAIAWVVAGPLAAVPGRFSGEVFLEGEVYLSPALYEGQEENYASIGAQPEYRLDWDNGDQNLNVTLFGRLDSEDKRRTHADVRELQWTLAREYWELRTGIGRVFWGVTESRHLVDTVNQTDLIENPDGEEKLGQPMLEATVIPPFGTLKLYALPYFRERTFPGVKGRQRAPAPVDVDRAQYESPKKERHFDWAARWAQSAGPFDYGLSYFEGTGREPELVLALDSNGRPYLFPRYELIRRGGIDAQITMAGWLFKLEAVYQEERNQPAENFAAAVAGFEYTFVGIFNSRMDLGTLAEYLYDERGEQSSQPFDDDVFFGLRLAWNDAADTSVLVGAIVDRHRRTTLLRLEGERRLGESWRLALEAQIVHAPPPDDAALFAVRRDDFLRLRLGYFY